MEQWFGFVLEIALITSGMFSLLRSRAHTAPRLGQHCFSHHPTTEEAEGAQETGRRQTRAGDPTDQRDIAHNTMVST